MTDLSIRDVYCLFRKSLFSLCDAWQVVVEPYLDDPRSVCLRVCFFSRDRVVV